MHRLVAVNRSSEDVTPELTALLTSLGGLGSSVSAAVGASGGVKRADLVVAARPELLRSGFALGAAGTVLLPAEGGAERVEVDAFHARTRTAVSVLGGRAWTNHEAVMAMLKMAAADDVAVALLVVPERYKGSPAAAPIAAFAQRLSEWRGVHLDLDAVTVISY